MKTVFDTIVSLGGTCFYTGASLRNRLLEIDPSVNEVLVYGVSIVELKNILEKSGLIVDQKNMLVTADTGQVYQFKCISGIQDLHTLQDFTVNSIYLNCVTGAIYDPHHGVTDLYAKVIRIDRQALQTSPIKLLEGCRLAAELEFSLSVGTWYEFFDQARLAKFISGEVLHAELVKILLLDKPSTAVKLLQETRVLEAIFPELAACENVIQNKRAGVKNVFEHVMYTLDAAEKDLTIRLTMLFHDVAKPQTLELGEDGKIHFFRHEVVGARLAKQYLKYWAFDKDLVQKVSQLVLHHMFDADPRLTDKSVKRLIKKVGKDLIYDLLKVRIADRLGTPNTISMKKIKVLKKKIDKEIDNI